jgi:hypothetical protein
MTSTSHRRPARHQHARAVALPLVAGGYLTAVIVLHMTLLAVLAVAGFTAVACIDKWGRR